MDNFTQWYNNLSEDKKEETNILLGSLMKQVDLPKVKIGLPDEPLRSKMKASIIGKGGSKINALKTGTGSNISVKDDHVLIIGGDLDTAIKSVREIMGNVVCTYPHPEAILNCFPSSDQAYVLVPYSQIQGQNTYRFKASDELPSPLSIVPEVEPLHYLYNKHLLERLPTNQSYKVCTYIGAVTFYDANRGNDLAPEMLNKIWSYDAFKHCNIGYGKDIKSAWEGKIKDEDLHVRLDPNDLVKEVEETLTCCVSITHGKWFIIKDGGDKKIIKDTQHMFRYYNIIQPSQPHDVRLNVYQPTSHHDIELEPNDLIIRYRINRRKQVYMSNGIKVKKYITHEADQTYCKIRLNIVNDHPSLDEIDALIHYTTSLIQ